MFKPRFIYTCLLWLLLPYAFFHLFWRARKQPEYLQHAGERFGLYAPVQERPYIWLHTVSVGETRAAATLIKQLQAQHPDHHILLTHTTPTGRATSEQLFGDNVTRVYLPYDYPPCVHRFLRHFRPRVGVLLETEIWFNLIHACRKQSIPLLLLNARLSERSAQRYKRFPKLVRSGLRELYQVAAQTDSDAQRLDDLGATNVAVMGNLKFDILPDPDQQQAGLRLRHLFGDNRPVLLAASTREGEEALILDLLPHIQTSNLLLVIVPRHPQRFDEVAALVQSKRLVMQRRSENSAVGPETQIVLGDSMGELVSYYAACDVAFIGGSLLPFGGQNLIEAMACGKPVLIGPHTYNFAQASEAAVKAGAAIRLSHAADLANELDNLMQDNLKRHAMSESGRQFVQANQGASHRAAMYIEQAMGSRPNK